MNSNRDMFSNTIIHHLCTYLFAKIPTNQNYIILNSTIRPNVSVNNEIIYLLNYPFSRLSPLFSPPNIKHISIMYVQKSPIQLLDVDKEVYVKKNGGLFVDEFAEE